MGYRSKVIFGVKEQYQDKFYELINKACELENNDYYKTKIRVVSPIYLKDDWIVFEDDYLKWYDDYDSIKLINDTIEEWYDCDDDMGAFRICLGEDGYKDEYGEWYDVVNETHDIFITQRTE